MSDDSKCPECTSQDLSGSVYRPRCNTCGWDSNDKYKSDPHIIFMLLPDGAEWEDMILILNKEDAIAASIKYYKMRVEIFKKKENEVGYTPTYNYYKKGELKLYNL
jgi:hypothetical protein